MRRTTKQNDGADLAEKEQLTASATERAALAAVLDDPQKAIPIALRYAITGEDFTDKARGSAFDAALALFAEGGGVDQLTVAERLIQQGDAEGAAAAEDAQAVALEAAERGRPVAVHAEDYLRSVGRRAQKRRLSSVGTLLSLEAVRPESDPAALAQEAVGTLSRIVSASKGERTPGEIVAEAVQEWIDVADGKREARGVPAPSAGMAEALGRMEPGLHVLAGKTSAGKSIVEGAVARHVALSGGRVLRCSLDMSAGDLLARDLAALCWLHLPRIKREKKVLIDERAFLPLAVKAYAGLPFTVCENADLPEIVARARALKADGGLALVTVDFVQNVNTGNPKIDAGGNAKRPSWPISATRGQSNKTPARCPFSTPRQHKRRGRRKGGGCRTSGISGIPSPRTSRGRSGALRSGCGATCFPWKMRRVRKATRTGGRSRPIGNHRPRRRRTIRPP